MQYAVVASPASVGLGQVTDVLEEHGYILISSEPVEKYLAREVELWIVANCPEMVDEFDVYTTYQVVGPSYRFPKFVFDNVPTWLSIKFKAKFWSGILSLLTYPK